MKVTRFQKFKKSIPMHIGDFSFEADKDVGDNEWEAAVHRHSAAKILVWIIKKTGATLRKSQLVEAWRVVVRNCWNVADHTVFCENDSQSVLWEIGNRMLQAPRVPVPTKGTRRYEVQAVNVDVYRLTRVRRVMI